MDSSSDDEDQTMIQAQPGGSSSISYLSGLIGKPDIEQFKKLLFRATHGKVLCKICEGDVVEYSQLDTSFIKEGDNSGKCVFVLVF